MPRFELEPFTVTGEEILITIYARDKSDRAYATRFAHSVVEIAYVTLERNPGKGLVIMGDSKDPHPLRIFERFVEIAKAQGPQSEHAEYAATLEASLMEWRSSIKINESNEDDLGLDEKTITNALPMPLSGIAADLYLLAWEQRFDANKVEQILQGFTSADLEGNTFSEYDWIFYLPPRNSLNDVLNEILPKVMKKEKMGVFKRLLVRGAIATFKPVIKDAMESIRKSILYYAILTTSGGFNEGDIGELARVYFDSQMPKGKLIGGGKRERALEAVERQKIANAEYAKDPFIAPEPIENFDPTSYARCEGYYGAEGHETKRFFLKDGSLYWQEGKKDPIEYLLAGDMYFVSVERNITLEFFQDENGDVTGVELRDGRYRFRFTFPKFPASYQPAE